MVSFFFLSSNLRKFIFVICPGISSLIMFVTSHWLFLALISSSLLSQIVREHLVNLFSWKSIHLQYTGIFLSLFHYFRSHCRVNGPCLLMTSIKGNNVAYLVDSTVSTQHTSSKSNNLSPSEDQQLHVILYYGGKWPRP